MTFTAGERYYDKNSSEYGEVARTSILGLTDNPVILLDDDATYKAFIGETQKAYIVNSDTGMDPFGNVVEIPLDVRKVGIIQLTAAGISTEQQGTIFANWRLLDQTSKDTTLAQWAACSTQEEIDAFIASMVTNLG
jgi:hypothetical protein